MCVIPDCYGVWSREQEGLKAPPALVGPALRISLANRQAMLGQRRVVPSAANLARMCPIAESLEPRRGIDVDEAVAAVAIPGQLPVECQFDTFTKLAAVDLVNEVCLTVIERK